MKKIKLNLVSGAVVEKPLVNAFKANNNSYVVLDNEINGSMGLPIILVSKLDNNKLIKIEDQNEWQVVKECLKNIIAGGQIDFISVNSELAADDIYYTQLTLPIPSFETLKSSYKVEDVVAPTTDEVGVMDIDINSELPTFEDTPSVPNQEPIADASTTPVNGDSILEQQPVAPVVEETAVQPEPIVDENKPLIDISNSPEQPVATPEPTPEPVTETVQETPQEPTIPLEAEAPVFNVNPEVGTPLEKQFEPEISPTPIIETEIPSSQPDTSSVFKEQKEAFMKACENMFDALVQKFEKELENRK